jgi:PAS domain S-box-containing protein
MAADKIALELRSYAPLFSNNSEDSKQGIVSIEGVPMLVSAHPIFTSLNEGPARGTLIMGQVFDNKQVSMLSMAVGLPLSVCNVNQPVVSQDFIAAKNNLTRENPYFTRPINDTTIATYALVEDLNSNPVLIVRIDDFRTAYGQGIASMSLTLGSFILIGVVLFVVIAVFLETQIVSKLTLLNRTIIDVKKTGDNKNRIKVTGHDELSRISENFNGMLEVIEKNTESLESRVAERTSALLENQEKIKSILNATPDAIVALDLQGAVLDCNPQVSKLCGYGRDELVGKLWANFVSLSDQQLVTSQFSKLFARDIGVARIECHLVKKDKGEYIAEVSASLLRNAQGESSGFVCVVRDQTEKKLLEERLFKSERLAAIGELAGMIGHDLRNPLAGVKNATYFLRKKQSKFIGDSGCEMLTVIERAVEYANKIVDDLLDYSREVKLQLEQTFPKAILDYVVMSLEFPKNIVLKERVDPSAVILADTVKVQRVFTNIVKNAIDAMPNGGILEITSKLDGADFTVSISDTGIGMSEEVQAKIFTPLFTTKAQGMGFGLPICKRIVEAHGGTIKVSSVPGKGTTFDIVFPVKR